MCVRTPRHCANFGNCFINCFCITWHWYAERVHGCLLLKRNLTIFYFDNVADILLRGACEDKPPCKCIATLVGCFARFKGSNESTLLPCLCFFLRYHKGCVIRTEVPLRRHNRHAIHPFVERPILPYTIPKHAEREHRRDNPRHRMWMSFR